MSDQPSPVDSYVGARIRYRRKAIGVSQDALGKAVGVTFQQCQKYERGINRVSASAMVKIANCLKTTPGFFFDGAPGTEGGATDADDSSAGIFLAAAQVPEIALLPKLPRNIQKAVGKMIAGAAVAAIRFPRSPCCRTFPSNKFAAHSACNVRAGHLSAPEKIALREQMRAESAVARQDAAA